MIRYELPTGQSLEAVVDAFDATWRSKNTVWDGSSSPWSDIKPVFVRLQCGKCAYCERLIQANEAEKKSESDIEHYRPKKKVALTAQNSGRVTGYPWLATSVGNYLLSCKTCNTTRKKNIFPIFARAGLNKQSIAALNAREQPLLLYPIGD